jgi:hypothetical protein
MIGAMGWRSVLALAMVAGACALPEATRQSGGAGGQGGGGGGAAGGGEGGGGGSAPMCPPASYGTQLAGTGIVEPSDLARAPDGTSGVAGDFSFLLEYGEAFTLESPDALGAFVIGMELAGSPSWGVSITGEQACSAVSSLVATPAGHYIFAGQCEDEFTIADAFGQRAQGTDAYIAEVDGHGHLVWAYALEGQPLINPPQPGGGAVDPESRDYFIAGGAFSDVTLTKLYPAREAPEVREVDSGAAPWLVRIAGDGTLRHFTLWDGGDAVATQVLVARDGASRYLLGRCTSGFLPGMLPCGLVADVFVLRLADDEPSLDVPQDGRVVGSDARYDVPYRAEELDDGDLLLLAATQPDGGANGDFVLGDATVPEAELDLQGHDLVLARLAPTGSHTAWAKALRVPVTIPNAWLALTSRGPVLSVSLYPDGPTELDTFSQAGQDDRGAAFFLLDAADGAIAGTLVIDGPNLQEAFLAPACGDTLVGRFQGPVTLGGEPFTSVGISTLVSYQPDGIPFER